MFLLHAVLDISLNRATVCICLCRIFTYWMLVLFFFCF